MRVTAAFGVALLVTLLLPVSFHAADAATQCSYDNCWAQAGAAVLTQLAGYQSFQVTYKNDINASMTGIVFSVVRNSLGQTVEISISSLQLDGGQNGSAFPIVSGLAPGTYSATFFATSPSGVAISVSSNQSFTI